jgi:ribonuclease P protein component
MPIREFAFWRLLQEISPFRPGAFPQFFPQLWKTSGLALPRPCKHGEFGAGTGTIAQRFSRPQLTPQPPFRYYLCFSVRSNPLQRGFQSHGEGRTHISAESTAPEADSRVPGAHGDEEGPAGTRTPPGQGSQAPGRDRLTLGVREFTVRSQEVRGPRPASYRLPAAKNLPMPSNALPSARRIRRRGEFQRVFDDGRRVHGRHLTIIAAPAPGGESRLGIVASKKLGGAVVRNRAKRLIREMFRTNARPGAMDLVIIPKPSAITVQPSEVIRDYCATLKRLSKQ